MLWEVDIVLSDVLEIPCLCGTIFCFLQICLVSMLLCSCYVLGYWRHELIHMIYEWMAQWYSYSKLTTAYFCYFPSKFRNVTHYWNESENNERYEIKPRTMFVQRSERNIWLVGWGKDPTHPSGSWELARYFFQISALTCSWLRIRAVQLYIACYRDVFYIKLVIHSPN